MEKTTRLDREIMYLLNKLKLYKPKPKPTPQVNETDAPTGSDTQQEEEVSDAETESETQQEVDEEAAEGSTEETAETESEEETQQEVDTEPADDNSEKLEIEAGVEQEHGGQGPDSNAEVETGDSQTEKVDEAEQDTPALEAPEVGELSREEEGEEVATASPEAERHKEL